MSWLIPNTLTGRLIALFVMILLISQALTLYVVVGEQRIAGRSSQVDALIEQVLEEVPKLGPIARTDLPILVRNGDRGSGIVFLTAEDWTKTAENGQSMPREARALAQKLALASFDEASVSIVRQSIGPGESRARPPAGLSQRLASRPPGPPPEGARQDGPPDRFGGPRSGGRGTPAGPQPGNSQGLEQLIISAQVRPGLWLTVMMPYVAGEAVTARAALVTGAMLIVAIGCVLFLSRWILRPINELGAAAERFGRGAGTGALKESGPRDVQAAAKAFNRMQNRLARLLETQQTMLRAVGHDLRTPITSLRIRAEDLPASQNRDKIIATLDDMTVMTAEILGWAKDASALEELANVDLGALIGSIADDYADQGRPAAFIEPDMAIVAPCRRVALRRALQNLIDNALKYGTSAAISIESAADQILIHVDDTGPGIDPGQLDDVLRPFVRLEASRSKQTGGIGLGLSIAQSIIEAHGGTLQLSNRPTGGLRATLILP